MKRRRSEQVIKLNFLIDEVVEANEVMSISLKGSEEQSPLRNIRLFNEIYQL